MLQNPPSAVYKCILPVGKSPTAPSAIYHSPLDQSREAAQMLPFPAWPEIKNPYRSACLVRLWRALYFPEIDFPVEPKRAETRAEEYLSRPEVIEREISEQIIAFEKVHEKPQSKCQKSIFQQLVELATHPQILSNTHNNHIELLRQKLWRELDNSTVRISNAFVQAAMYGYLENFYGVEGAFSFGHEFGHYYASWFHSGFVLDELSKHGHMTLATLATASLSREGIAELWTRFWKIHKKIEHLAKKFKPVEEIFATYFGMHFLPTDVRNAVKASVKKDLEANNWYEAYESFVDACDNCQVYASHAAAFFIIEPVFRILEQNDIDGADLLYKFSEIHKIIWSCVNIKEPESAITQDEIEAVEKINIILEQAGIPYEVFDSATEIAETLNPQINLLCEAARNDFSRDGDQAILFPPLAILIGRPPHNDITPFIFIDPTEEYEDNLSPYERVVYESLWQQLIHDCGFVCPLAYKGKPCCGFKKELRRLYERLPTEARKQFTLPRGRYKHASKH